MVAVVACVVCVACLLDLFLLAFGVYLTAMLVIVPPVVSVASGREVGGRHSLTHRHRTTDRVSDSY